MEVVAVMGGGRAADDGAVEAVVVGVGGEGEGGGYCRSSGG